MSGRDKTAVLIKETLGWSYQRALTFKRKNYTRIMEEAKRSGRSFMDVAVDLAEKPGDDEKDQNPAGTG